MAATADQLQARAESLHRAARGHLQLSRRHRQRARRKFREFDDVVERAAQQGITIKITESRGGQSERQTEETNS